MPPKSPWNEEELKRVAEKCVTRKEFRERHSAAYWRCVRLKIIEEVCSHMPKRCEQYWTKEKVFRLASKYEVRDKFRKEQSGAYKYAKRTGILEEVCSHMFRKTNDPEQLVYIYRYSDDTYAYIGIAQDVNERRRTHLFPNSTTNTIAKTLIRDSLPEVLHYKGSPIVLPRRTALIFEKELIKSEEKVCLNVRHNQNDRIHDLHTGRT